jgi:hypothetical protein
MWQHGLCWQWARAEGSAGPITEGCAGELVAYVARAPEGRYIVVQGFRRLISRITSARPLWIVRESSCGSVLGDRVYL